MKNNISRRGFLKLAGSLGLSALIGTNLISCDHSKEGNNNEIEEEIVNDSFTKTNEVQYFEVGEHVIYTRETGRSLDSSKNGQITVPEGYEVVGASSSIGGAPISYNTLYWANKVPVEADIYIDNKENLSCPFPGKPVELKKDTSNKTK